MVSRLSLCKQAGKFMLFYSPFSLCQLPFLTLSSLYFSFFLIDTLKRMELMRTKVQLCGSWSWSILCQWDQGKMENAFVLWSGDNRKIYFEKFCIALCNEVWELNWKFLWWKFVDAFRWNRSLIDWVVNSVWFFVDA